MANFASLEQRLNRVCLARMANAMVQFAGGVEPVVCQFDDGYTLGTAGPFGIAGSQPKLTLPTAQVPANPVGQAAVVAGQVYQVAEHQPDGTGISVLLLEVAA